MIGFLKMLIKFICIIVLLFIIKAKSKFYIIQTNDDNIEGKQEKFLQYNQQDYADNGKCLKKVCGASCKRVLGKGPGICDGKGECANPMENPCAQHGCKGKLCGEQCLLGDILGLCDVKGSCSFNYEKAKNSCGVQKKCPTKPERSKSGKNEDSCITHSDCSIDEKYLCQWKKGYKYGKCKKKVCSSHRNCSSFTDFPSKCKDGACITKYCYSNKACPRGYGCHNTMCKKIVGKSCHMDCDCGKCNILCFKSNCYCKDGFSNCTATNGTFKKKSTSAYKSEEDYYIDSNGGSLEMSVYAELSNEDYNAGTNNVINSKAGTKNNHIPNKLTEKKIKEKIL